jgi:hypothetical protein
MRTRILCASISLLALLGAAASVDARPTKYLRYMIMRKPPAGVPVAGSSTLRAS